MGQREGFSEMCGNDLTVWQARRGGDVRPAALLPMAAQCGDQCCRLGRAGPGWEGRGEGGGGTLQGFGSALIRVIITAGTHIHTHANTLALVFAAGVCPDYCAPSHGQR